MVAILSEDIELRIKAGGPVDPQDLVRWQSDAKHLEELVKKLAAIASWSVLKESVGGVDYEGMETVLAKPENVRHLLKQCENRTGK